MQGLGVAGSVEEASSWEQAARRKIGSVNWRRITISYSFLPSLHVIKKNIRIALSYLLLRHCHSLEWDRVIPYWILFPTTKPIAYFSENLNESRKKYLSYDKEFYAFVQSLKHSALQYVMQQRKLNHKHAKWAEYLQSYTFVLKNISGQTNKVADALSRRVLLLQESTIQVLGFEHLKDLYQTDADFKEAYEACQNPLMRNNSPWLDYNLHEKLLFKGGQLCIPDCSMRENIIWEKHSGGVVEHFGIDKTLDQLSHFIIG